MRCSTLLSWSLLLCTLCTPPMTHAATPPERWPATRAGTLGSAWVGAFCAGEDSMRAFLTHHMAAASLAERSVSARLTRYREMSEQYGRFQLVSVVESGASAVTVKLLDAQARSHEAVFALEDQAPFKLKSVTLRSRVAGGHSLFGGFHH